MTDPEPIAAYLDQAAAEALIEQLPQTEPMYAATWSGAFGVIAFGTTAQQARVRFRLHLRAYLIEQLRAGSSELSLSAFSAWAQAQPEVMHGRVFADGEDFMAALGGWETDESDRGS